MSYIAKFAVPVLIAAFVGMGLFKRVGVYDCFIEGAKDGLQSIVGILAPLVGLMVAIHMFRAAGVTELIADCLAPLLSKIGLPAEVLPLAILRPVSGSASIAVVTDIFKEFGPDSAAGRIASVMMGSTETTFYTVAVYFGAVGIKNTRHTIPSALAADFTGMIMAVLITNMIWG